MSLGARLNRHKLSYDETLASATQQNMKSHDLRMRQCPYLIDIEPHSCRLLGCNTASNKYHRLYQVLISAALIPRTPTLVRSITLAVLRQALEQRHSQQETFNVILKLHFRPSAQTIYTEIALPFSRLLFLVNILLNIDWKLKPVELMRLPRKWNWICLPKKSECHPQ